MNRIKIKRIFFCIAILYIFCCSLFLGNVKAMFEHDENYENRYDNVYGSDTILDNCENNNENKIDTVVENRENDNENETANYENKISNEDHWSSFSDQLKKSYSNSSFRSYEEYITLKDAMREYEEQTQKLEEIKRKKKLFLSEYFKSAILGHQEFIIKILKDLVSAKFISENLYRLICSSIEDMVYRDFDNVTEETFKFLFDYLVNLNIDHFFNSDKNFDFRKGKIKFLDYFSKLIENIFPFNRYFQDLLYENEILFELENKNNEKYNYDFIAKGFSTFRYFVKNLFEHIFCVLFIKKFEEENCKSIKKYEKFSNIIDLYFKITDFVPDMEYGINKDKENLQIQKKMICSLWMIC